MSKYNSRKYVCDHGHMHDSKREALRCNELHWAQSVGQISDLEVQKSFELIPPTKYTRMENERGVKYIADFTYYKNGVYVIEDSKGYKTAEYIIKRKLLKRQYCAGKDAIFIET